MRWVICALVVLALPTSAFAADLDILRGSEPVGPGTYFNWSGFYFGGQIGLADVNADFANSTSGPIAYALRESALELTSQPSALVALGTLSHYDTAFGGFAGFNSQWQDLMLGIEANYNLAAHMMNAPSSPIERSNFSDGLGNTYTVGISATGAISSLNYGSVRARAGWIVGNFMPYGFAGVALGVADINVTANVCIQKEPPDACSNTAIFFTATGGRNTAMLYGFVVGGGMDVALTHHLFLRGEWDYTQFAAFDSIPIAIYSARLGAAVKF